MENSDEVGVPEFVHLMKDFLNARIDAHTYQKNYFELMKKRITLSEKESRILQQTYGDADDYDPVARLPYTIEEPELRHMVRKSLEELAVLGY